MLKAFIDMALRTNIKKLNNWHSYCTSELKLIELIMVSAEKLVLRSGLLTKE